MCGHVCSVYTVCAMNYCHALVHRMRKHVEVHVNHGKLITIFMIMCKTMSHFTLFICHCTSLPSESWLDVMYACLWCVCTLCWSLCLCSLLRCHIFPCCTIMKTMLYNFNACSSFVPFFPLLCQSSSSTTKMFQHWWGHYPWRALPSFHTRSLSLLAYMRSQWTYLVHTYIHAPG